jgi:hypothetical protein
MRSLLLAIVMVAATTAFADNLEDLKAAAVRYVAAMKAVPALSDGSDCTEAIARANEYAAAKIGYYRAARQAMPALLQIAKGENTGNYWRELTETFLGFGEDKDEEATESLEARLSRCRNVGERDQAVTAVENAKQIAEQFVKDFGRLEGT